MGQGAGEGKSDGRVDPERKPNLILIVTPARFPRLLRRLLRGASKGRRHRKSGMFEASGGGHCCGQHRCEDTTAPQTAWVQILAKGDGGVSAPEIQDLEDQETGKDTDEENTSEEEHRSNQVMRCTGIGWDVIRVVFVSIEYQVEAATTLEFIQS
ncbi:hypothetical protein G5714_000816 [Onychostoma macrolepis]|uniref:Uncharacterized protein n=1 Tax=Onychostoma macrolepis TaxID=369639 RepID=A0A7J6DID6_9TELE|nr:hypothetical protein G5714_000816 [Onychostoma macrolepis]